LVGLGLSAVTLEIDHLLDSFSMEDVVTPFCTLFEPKIQQETPQI
jgi:hypothetical protein